MRLVEMAEPFVRPRMRAYGYVADLVVASGHRGAGIGPRPLAEAERLLCAIEGIAFCRFTDVDVVRHPLVQKIIVRYEARDAKLREAREKRT